MITKDEVTALLTSKESFRVERTISTTDKDKFGEAVCAFANDMPDSGKPGYLLIGVDDDGSLSGLKATDDLLKKFAAIRSDGNVLPIPSLSVDAVSFPDGDVIVVEALPKIDTFIETGVIRKFPVKVSALREGTIHTYPKGAIRELAMNAIMHRDYQGNAPVRLYQFKSSIEIQNHGGLYGRVRPENFPNINDISRVTAFRVSVGQSAVESEKLGKELGKGLGEKSGEKISVESTDQTTEKATETEKKIIALMRENKSITQNAIAEKLGITRNYVAKMTMALTARHLIRRVGSDRGGHWEVMS